MHFLYQVAFPYRFLFSAQLSLLTYLSSAKYLVTKHLEGMSRFC